MSPQEQRCVLSTTPIAISAAVEQQSGELELSFGQGGRDVFVLNVPSCECLGRPSAPFGLGWISQGGEEMEQSSTHILRQFHAGFLKNANVYFFLFFPFLGTGSGPGVGFAQTPVSLCQGRRLLQVLGLLRFVLLPNATLLTVAQVPPSPAALKECRAHPEGKNPKEVIKATGIHPPPR